MMRVAYFMLRKGITKRKLLLDLNMMVKRGKVAGNKALHNLMSHHHHHKGPSSSSLHDEYSNVDQHEDDEFSCTNSPTTTTTTTTTIKKHEKEEEDVDIRAVNAAVLKAMKMIQSETPSRFGKSSISGSPMVRQLRVTDSPFPLSNVADEEDSHVVDEAAEKFINRFYNNLRRQNNNNNASSSFGS